MRAAAFPPMPSGLFESYFTVFPRKWQEKYADSPDRLSAHAFTFPGAFCRRHIIAQTASP